MDPACIHMDKAVLSKRHGHWHIEVIVFVDLPVAPGGPRGHHAERGGDADRVLTHRHPAFFGLTHPKLGLSHVVLNLRIAAHRPLDLAAEVAAGNGPALKRGVRRFDPSLELARLFIHDVRIVGAHGACGMGVAHTQRSQSQGQAESANKGQE